MSCNLFEPLSFASLSFGPCSQTVSALLQFTFRYFEMVVAVADIKNHSYFIIILLSADSLLVDVYIFFMGTPSNVTRMFSYRSAELLIYLVALCLCFIDECLQFSTRLHDYFNVLFLCFHGAYGEFKIHDFF